MRIDIWSDVVCPWCYIGFTRLESVIEEYGKPVEVYHHAYQLDPNAVGVEPTVPHLAQKYGISEEDAIGMMEDVGEAAALVGLKYRLAETSTGNTRLAHRLLAAAAVEGRGHLLLQRLFAAYFEGAQPIFSAEDLRPHALAVGLNPETVEEVFISDLYDDHVEADLQLANQVGVRAVPFFVFNGRIAIAGADSAEVLLAAMAKAEEA